MIEIRRAFEDNGRPIVGLVAIDSLVNKSSSGGVRLRPDLTIEELRVLASRMTLKYGFLGIPQGGAKAGITIDPGLSPEAKRRVLRGFGREIASLVADRTFIPGPDMGTAPDDIRFVYEGAGSVPSPLRFSAEGSGHHTGTSVFASAAAAMEVRGEDLAGARVAIEGFGKVGSAAARLFARNGAKVIAVSTEEGGLADERGLPIAEMIEAARTRGPAFVREFPGGQRISRESLLSLDMDILCPCAMVHAIHEGTVGSVHARIISSGANAPITDAALASLHSRSVLVLPDFITNAGGVLGIFLEIAGFGVADVDRLVPELIGPRIRELVRLVDKRGISPHDAAVRAAFARFKRFKAESEGKSGKGGLLSHRTVRAVRRILPRVLARRAGLAYFRRRLGRPMFEEF